jgi:hypothetical protein
MRQYYPELVVVITDDGGNHTVDMVEALNKTFPELPNSDGQDTSTIDLDAELTDELVELYENDLQLAGVAIYHGLCSIIEEEIIKGVPDDQA